MRLYTCCRPSQEMDSAVVLEKRRKFIGYNTTLLYSEPLHVVDGKGCHLYTAEGVELLDCVNNVAHVGHGHPKVSLGGIQIYIGRI